MTRFLKTDLPVGFYRGLLVVASIIWGLGFVIAKSAIEVAGATWVIGIRFILSGLILAVILFPRLKKHLTPDLIKAGVIIGAFSFFGFWTQFVGLGLTTPSKNAFLSACYCITVPFIWWVVVRKRPSLKSFLTAAVCTVGIGFVSLTGDLTIGLGDGVSVLSAFAYGAEIVVIALVMKDYDVLTITTVQQLTAGVLGCGLALATQPVPAVEQVMTWEFVGAMAYVVLLPATFGSLAQNLAQKHVSASEAGLLCSLESVFCALFSVACFGEELTLKLLVGFALIFAAVVASQMGTGDDAEPTVVTKEV